MTEYLHPLIAGDWSASTSGATIVVASAVTVQVINSLALDECVTRTSIQR